MNYLIVGEPGELAEDVMDKVKHFLKDKSDWVSSETLDGVPFPRVGKKVFQVMLVFSKKDAAVKSVQIAPLESYILKDWDESSVGDRYTADDLGDNWY